MCSLSLTEEFEYLSQFNDQLIAYIYSIIKLIPYIKLNSYIHSIYYTHSIYLTDSKYSFHIMY